MPASSDVASRTPPTSAAQGPSASAMAENSRTVPSPDSSAAPAAPTTCPAPYELTTIQETKAKNSAMVATARYVARGTVRAGSLASAE